LGERQVHLGQSVIGPHIEKQPSPSIPGVNLESTINLTCMFVGGRKKPEYPEKTHIHEEKNSSQRKAPAGIQTWNPLAVRRQC